jgi:hypothetical protein
MTEVLRVQTVAMADAQKVRSDENADSEADYLGGVWNAHLAYGVGERLRAARGGELRRHVLRLRAGGEALARRPVGVFGG